MKTDNIIIVTYLIYIIIWELLCIGGAGYVVFVLHRNPIWFILGIIGSVHSYNPSHWRELIGKQLKE